MATLEITYVSGCLNRAVTFNVILPIDKLEKNGIYMEQGQKFKTLYLMNGLFGDYHDWLFNTRIRSLAEKRGLAVVMPSGENSFYIDQDLPNCEYGKFIGEELVSMTRRMLPLSEKREDTFIGGLSMGGFGALRNGLKYYNTFGNILAFSSAVHFFEGNLFDPEDDLAQASNVFGDMKAAAKSDKNPRVCMEELLKAKAKDPSISLPGIYMACGLQDDLLESNRIFRDALVQNGFDVLYTEEDGEHNWDFWDRHIERAMNWLNLAYVKEGISSGHVKD